MRNPELPFACQPTPSLAVGIRKIAILHEQQVAFPFPCRFSFLVPSLEYLRAMSTHCQIESTLFKRRRRRDQLCCMFGRMTKHKPSLLYLVLVWIITKTVVIAVAASSNGLGYSSATGSDPLCWRSVQPIDFDMISIPLPCQNVTLTLQEPAVEETYILRTGNEYEYPVEIHIPRLEESITKVGVKLLFCVPDRVGFCSPFVLDEHVTSDYDALYANNMPTNVTHVESETMWIDTLNQSSLEVNVSLMGSIPYPGEYFPIVIVQYSKS